MAASDCRGAAKPLVSSGVEALATRTTTGRPNPSRRWRRVIRLSRGGACGSTEAMAEASTASACGRNGTQIGLPRADPDAPRGETTVEAGRFEESGERVGVCVGGINEDVRRLGARPGRVPRLLAGDVVAVDGMPVAVLQHLAQLAEILLRLAEMTLRTGQRRLGRSGGDRTGSSAGTCNVAGAGAALAPSGTSARKAPACSRWSSAGGRGASSPCACCSSTFPRPIPDAPSPRGAGRPKPPLVCPGISSARRVRPRIFCYDRQSRSSCAACENLVLPEAPAATSRPILCKLRGRWQFTDHLFAVGMPCFSDRFTGLAVSRWSNCWW